MITDKFFGFLADKLLSDSVRVKDFIGEIPNELQYIYDVCKHEAIVNNDNVDIQVFYVDLYFNSLIEFFNFSYYEIDKNVIPLANKYLHKCDTEFESISIFNEISDKHHELYISMYHKKYKQLKFKNSDADVLDNLKKIINVKILGGVLEVDKDILKETIVL